MFDGRTPIYRQLAERIKADVLSGALPEDEQVTSTNQYAAFYRINPAAAVMAFVQLADEAILYKRRGLGMFVSPAAGEQLRSQQRARFYSEVVESMVAEARQIDVLLREIIARLEALEREVDQ